MAQKIKKISKKVIALICMITLVFSCSVTVNKTKAGTMTSVSDTMTDSRTGASNLSNHTINFVMPSLVNEGDTIVIKFDDASDNFTLTGLIEDDIDIAIDTDGTPGDCAGTLTDEETAAAAGVDIWGVVPTVGTDIITFTAPTNVATHIPAGSCVVVEVGSNATAHGTGTLRIGNPASEGTYNIDIVATNTAADTGKTQVAILDGVSVTATIAKSMTFTISEADDTVGFGEITPGTLRYASSDATGAASAPAAADDPFRLILTSNVADASITVKSINAGGTAGLYNAAPHTLTAVSADTIDNDAFVDGFAVYGVSSQMTMDSGFVATTGDEAVAITNKTFATASLNSEVNYVAVDLIAASDSASPAVTYATTLVFVATSVY